jgi:hypothetical protein
MKRRIKFTVAVLAFSAMAANAQTNSKKASSVGTWKLDTAHSDFGSEPSPKSVTSGPEDASMHAVKQQGGGDAGMQSAKRDSDGSLLRHGADKDGSSFDAHDTLSDDGNTVNEVVTAKSKDDKETKTTSVYHRVGAETSGAKS